MTTRWATSARKSPFLPQQQQQQRQFFPPSYYAAAGGYAVHQKNSEDRHKPTAVSSPSCGLGPAESSSESSFDYRPPVPTNTGKGPQMPSKKRESQGLHAEADLLPSLQTTISRMTRPPTKLPVVSTPRQKPAKVKSPVGMSEQLVPTSTAGMLSPETKHRLTSKSGLKSALRTPTPKTTDIVPETAISLPSPRTPSLRSVKSMLLRKTLNPPTSASSQTTPKPSKTVHPQSNLPRPKPRPEPRHPALPTEDNDSSDIEHRYERQWMDGRRLTVANADIQPSTSSSESTVSDATPRAPSRLRPPLPPLAYQPSPRYLPSQSPAVPPPSHSRTASKPRNNNSSSSKMVVGLGLEIPPPSPALPCETIGEGEYNDKPKILRFSLPPSDSGGSLASNRYEKKVRYPGRWDESESEREGCLGVGYERRERGVQPRMVEGLVLEGRRGEEPMGASERDDHNLLSDSMRASTGHVFESASSELGATSGDEEEFKSVDELLAGTGNARNPSTPGWSPHSPTSIPPSSQPQPVAASISQLLSQRRAGWRNHHQRGSPKPLSGPSFTPATPPVPPPPWSPTALRNNTAASKSPLVAAPRSPPLGGSAPIRSPSLVPPPTRSPLAAATPKANRVARKPVVPVRPPRGDEEHNWLAESDFDDVYGTHTVSSTSVSQPRPQKHQQQVSSPVQDPHLQPRRGHQQLPFSPPLKQKERQHPALRAREAFGIPPSTSDELIFMGRDVKPSNSFGSESSDTSLSRWDEDEDSILGSSSALGAKGTQDAAGLSCGAEKMIQSLNLTSDERSVSECPPGPTRYSSFSVSTDSSSYDDDEGREGVESGQSSDGDDWSRGPQGGSRHSAPHHRDDYRTSECYVQPSHHGSTPKLLPPRSTHHPPDPPTMARPEPFNRALGPQTDSHPPNLSNHTLPQQQLSSRDTIIHEFLTSEQTFLNTAQLCVSTFILPLRAQDKTWIGGVPEEVSRLLDWYEDIVNLHTGILRGLEGGYDIQGGGYVQEGTRIVAYLIDFIPKLQIYQPYLVRLEDLSEQMGGEVEDETSCFGEFVRMQEKSLVTDGGWTFEKLLTEPVYRLTAYLDIFTRLLDATPQDHPEYLATYTLSKSTETVMDVLTEVKVREDEYRSLKALAETISDLGVREKLAVRERRLLFSGWFRVVSSSSAPGSMATSTLATPMTMTRTPTIPSATMSSKSPHPHTPQLGSLLSSSLGNPSKSPGKNRTARLVNAINLWDRTPKPQRSASVKSSASSVTTSLDTVSSSMGSSDGSGRGSRLPRLKNLFRRRSGTRDDKDCSSATSSVGSAEAMPGDATPNFDRVLVYVFDDLLLLLAPSGTKNGEYDLLQKMGLSKVFSVDSEPTRLEGCLIKMKITPMPQITNDDTIAKNTMLASLTLELLGDPSHDPDIHRKRCLTALERSAQHTSKVLAFSGCSTSLSGDDPSGVLANAVKSLPPGLMRDTWLTVSSLLASGLPVPKSPSGELPRLDSWSAGVLDSRFGSSAISSNVSKSAVSRDISKSRATNKDSHRTSKMDAAGKVMEREERGWWALRFQQVLGEMKRRTDVCTAEY
ncbi:hypothetical protein BKA70DRAFT_1522283 [Coprinopsis sp. MPI-PUGE-AT-0042]|nr:hypothetical protein BKA70DRAFT_1522283 [Coprinopsis sp. MPI-PUGE-AT-0042]